MVSEPEFSEASTLFERLVTNRAMSLFLPNVGDPHQQSDSTEGTPRERVILINPITQGTVFVDGGLSVEALFHRLGGNGGGPPPPASKECIDAMQSVEVGEGEDGGECAVCLVEWEVGRVAKKMPCGHWFHLSCIEKWLGAHGSCPVCRYEMPVRDKDVGKKGGEEMGERREEGLAEKFGLVSLSIVVEEVRIQIRLLRMIPVMKVQEVVMLKWKAKG